jgi:hypothetical protein
MPSVCGAAKDKERRQLTDYKRSAPPLTVTPELAVGETVCIEGRNEVLLKDLCGGRSRLKQMLLARADAPFMNAHNCSFAPAGTAG